MELSVVHASANISRRSLDRKVEDPDAREREHALVVRAQGGDREAFEQLYRTHAPAVARLVRFRLGADDEDAVSEVFFRAWRGLGGYRDTGAPFSAWLYGIARHVAIDELRTRGRTEPTESVPDREVEHMTADLLTLRGAIDRLPTEQRQVIELKYLLGLTNDEVASAMGCTPGAVNAKQWRALRSLAGEMKEEAS
jgi:RNA polymerase sigma-70 factor (ECF subfamily)